MGRVTAIKIEHKYTGAELSARVKKIGQLKFGQIINLKDKGVKSDGQILTEIITEQPDKISS